MLELPKFGYMAEPKIRFESREKTLLLKSSTEIIMA